MRNTTLMLAALFLVVSSIYSYFVWGLEDVVRPEYRDEQAIGHTVLHLHEKKRATQPGDWLESHHEDGQTFAQYLNYRPLRLTKHRNKLYVQPIGTFEGKRKVIVDLAAEFMSIYFCCEVVVQKSITNEKFPANAIRANPHHGQTQLLTTFILDEILIPALPRDAFAMIAFTEDDLWAGEGWNFVFGQASLRERVGVWSIARNGDPNSEFDLCLERTLKIATHETGHMFSIEHCIEYECNLNGCNNREENDRQPLYLCPECLPKVLVATKADARDRFEKLAEFCRRNGLNDAASYYQQALENIVPRSR